MNKHQEALNKIIDCRQSMFQGYFNEKDTNLLQELVDKETPMKPLRYGCIQCGNCLNVILGTSKYCSNCGQAIDRSEDVGG